MKEIKINEGIILVDDEDYDFLIHLYDLSILKDGYVYCKLKEKFKNMQTGLFTGITLHKLLKLPDKTGRSVNVDHKDGNKLNNQKENLRICTHAENMRNRKANKTYAKKETQSSYKGIWWDRDMGMWRVQIKLDYSPIHIGCFTNEIAAANAYNYHAKKLHGEYSRLNEVPFMEKEEWKKFKAGNKMSSKYLGVSYSKHENKWLAQICHNYNREVIGRFDLEIDAAKAYNKRAIELRGNKAKLNKIA